MLEGDQSDCTDTEEESNYTGSVDSEGNPHGRGTLTFSSGDTFYGHFNHGSKHGRGCFSFSDGSSLTGNYHDDCLKGKGVYMFDDGGWVVGQYEDGELNGPSKEYDSDGRLQFKGEYSSNIRTGICWMYNPDGGSLVGKVDGNGAMTGKDIAYIYPDRKTALVGTFDGGAMKSAQLSYVAACKGKERRFSPYQNGFTFKYDISTRKRISSHPLQPDPYEQSRCYIKQSTIPLAKEGLFSKIEARAGEVMSFYNGIRLTHKEVDSRDWNENANTISLDEDVVIDVPAQHVSPDKYCASLGHKANHSFQPNCMYDTFDHPRFGPIKCIRTIKAVKRDEELTVTYDYNHHGDEPTDTMAPEWYLTLKKGTKH